MKYIKHILMITFGFSLIFSLSAQDREFSESEKMLAGIGFQLPREPFVAPDFTIKDLDGKKVSLSDYRGHIVVFNLWATWCPPCKAEMPSMEKLYTSFNDKNFTILAASSTGSNDTLAKVKAFINENGYTFPVLFDDSEAIDYSYHSGSIPTSYIIGTDGTIIARMVGSINWSSPQMFSIMNVLLES